jgi:spermidine/putrescine transport system permease protein
VRLAIRSGGRAPSHLAALTPAGLAWVLLFAGPLLYFFVISFWSVRARIMRPDFTGKNYVAAMTDYGDVLLHTLLIGLVIALITTAIAYAFAFAIRFRTGKFGDLLLVLTLLTLFGGYLVKIYAWKSILGRDGIINGVLAWLGLIDAPLTFFIYSANGVIITLAYFLLPFAVLPIYGNMRAIPDSLIEAARDPGASTFRASRDIVLPLSERGIAAAFLLSFLISVGDYVTPRYVGGGTSMMGHFIETQFSFGFNWPMGSAMAFTLMAASLAVFALCRFALRRLIGA